MGTRYKLSIMYQNVTKCHNPLFFHNDLRSTLQAKVLHRKGPFLRLSKHCQNRLFFLLDFLTKSVGNRPNKSYPNNIEITKNAFTK